MKIQAFVQGTIIECFLNGAYAFSCRACDCRNGKLFLSATGGAKPLDLAIKTNEQ